MCFLVYNNSVEGSVQCNNNTHNLNNSRGMYGYRIAE